MPTITISGTPIEFPSTGNSPDWSPAVIQFAEAVESALLSAIGVADVPPQLFTLLDNVNTNLDLPNLSFSTTEVRSVTIDFSVRRSTLLHVTEAKGRLNLLFDDETDVWLVQREDDIGNITSEVTFNVTNQGRVQINTTFLPGLEYQGSISYSAKALQKV